MSTKAAERIAREAAVQPYAKAAEAISKDFGLDEHPLSAMQIQRMANELAKPLLEQRETDISGIAQGRPPSSPANAPELLVIGVDGGKMQLNQKSKEDDSYWRDNKIVSVSTYLAVRPPEKPGDDPKPERLVSTMDGTLKDTHGFGPVARLEAEKRGLSNARCVVFLSDCGNWIGPLLEREFADVLPRAVRIADWYHAVEHLHAAAGAAHGGNAAQAAHVAEQLEAHLWHGRLERLIDDLKGMSTDAGEPHAGDGDTHPRRVLARVAGYFEKNRSYMNYPEYRRRGLPVGSGVAESAVKQFNKRVKGTEQYWSEPGGEAILALRGLWLSQDNRWNRHWQQAPAYSPP